MSWRLPPRRSATSAATLCAGRISGNGTWESTSVFPRPYNANRKLLADSDPALAQPLHPALPYCGAEVVWAARQEMARTLEDVLARRTRALFLNARAAIEMALRAADLLARELQRGVEWRDAQVESFRETARNYLLA
jgi:glycerol-3-phosphate dehydrogenase